MPGASAIASAEESIYPGKDRLLVGRNVTALAHNFSWIRGCRHDFDYNGYLDTLKKHSEADWRYFKRKMIGSYDGSAGCRAKTINNTVEWLEKYLAWIVYLAERCEDQMECYHAGRKF
ncbi:MAG: hypothetical protein ACON4P_04050 [Candidatus Puniceispirillales bacterium]